jgi:hypothetical protein
MITLCNLILETTLYEEEDPTKWGWKHIAFGTWESPTGKRFKKDEDGEWRQVGGSDFSFNDDTKEHKKREAIKSVAGQYIDPKRIKMISDAGTKRRTNALVKISQLESDKEFSRAINDERLERVREDIGEMVSLIDADNESESAGEDFLRKLEKMASETGDDASRLRIEFEEGKMNVGGDRELAMSVRKAMMGVLGNHIKMASGGSNPKGYGY